jgi:hypothetical protein
VGVEKAYSSSVYGRDVQQISGCQILPGGESCKPSRKLIAGYPIQNQTKHQKSVASGCAFEIGEDRELDTIIARNVVNLYLLSEAEPGVAVQGLRLCKPHSAIFSHINFSTSSAKIHFKVELGNTFIEMPDHTRRFLEGFFVHLQATRGQML